MPLENPTPAPSPLPPKQIVQLSLAVYAPMIASGVFVRAPGNLRMEDISALLQGLAATLPIALLVVVLSRLASRRTRWGRAMHLEFQAMLQGLDSRHILILSLLSAFGEELLFRGVLQPRLGMFWAVLLFAALHFPYRRVLIPWTVFALILGGILGLLTEYFASLWPAILLHFLINYFNLHDLAPDPGSSVREA